MKDSIDKVIQTKIQELFAYRRLTDLFSQSGLPKGHQLLTDLAVLQYQIYLLDAYLETTWSLDTSKLNEHWTGIRSALLALNITDKKEQKKLLKEIRSYERIESNCRTGKWPTEISFKKFYTIKSCDVRLIRHLLYTAQPGLNSFYNQDAWVYYDLITEVNDDITDVYEDLETYNGNRFLISILRSGHLKTAAAYRKFLSEVAYNAEAFFKIHHQTGENALLFEWTAERVVETMKLLQHTIDLLDHSRISTSFLLEKMK